MLKVSLDHCLSAFSVFSLFNSLSIILFTAGVTTTWLRTFILENKSLVIQCSWTHNWNPERHFGGVRQNDQMQFS